MSEIWDQLTPTEIEYLGEKFATYYEEAEMNWVKLTLMPVDDVLFLMGNSPPLHGVKWLEGDLSSKVFERLNRKLSGGKTFGRFPQFIKSLGRSVPFWYDKHERH